MESSLTGFTGLVKLAWWKWRCVHVTAISELTECLAQQSTFFGLQHGHIKEWGDLSISSLKILACL